MPSFSTSLMLLWGLSIVLLIANRSWANRRLAISLRWLTWVLFSLIFAQIATEYEWFSRPFPVLAATGFAIWFLAGTLTSWLGIRVVNRSEVPVFPKYHVSEKDNEWPNTPCFISLKDYFRKYNYTCIAPLISHLFGSLYISSWLYESPCKTKRIQVLLLPSRSAQLQATFSITSLTEDGSRVITNNMMLPFGGYYPESWHIIRKPLVTSLSTLLKYHDKALKKLSTPVKGFEDEAIEDLDLQQSQLEGINLEKHFLNPRTIRSEEGSLTAHGRSRIWKEAWLLRYLGRALG